MHKDGKYGWLIAMGSFVICFLSDGIRYSYGILFIEFLTEFGESKCTTSWIGSIMFGLMNLLGPVTSALVNKFGCRPVTIAGSVISALGFVTSFFGQNVYHLYVTMGIIGGTGFSLLTIPFVVIITNYFEKKRSLAMGISMCGSGLGSIVFGPLSKWLIDVYGWRGTLLIEGSMLLNCIPCGLLMRPISLEVQTKGNSASRLFEEVRISCETELEALSSDEPPQESVISTCDQSVFRETDELHNKLNTANNNNSNNIHVKTLDISSSTWFQYLQSLFSAGLLKEYTFILILVAVFFEGLAFDTPLTFLPDLVVTWGHTRLQASIYLTLIGITSTISRVPVGFIADLKYVNRLYFLICVFMLFGICIIVMPFCETSTTMLVICAGLGLFLGSYVVLFPLVLADLFGADRISDSKGLTCCMTGISVVSGVPIAGAIHDATGTHTMAFITAGLEYVFGAGMLIFIACKRATRLRKKDHK